MDLEGARKKGIPRNPENTTHFLSNYITVISEPWVDSTSTVSKVDSSLLRTRMIPSCSTKALKIEETILQWKESLAPRTSSDWQQTNKDWLSVALGIYFSKANLWHKIAEWLKDPDLCEGSREHGQVYLWPHGTYINMHHAKPRANVQCFCLARSPSLKSKYQHNAYSDG